MIWTSQLHPKILLQPCFLFSYIPHFHGLDTATHYRIVDVNIGLNNLNAYYVPEGNETNLYDGISPVNTFRVIFNDYFNSNFELLEDRYFWMVTDKEPYHFIDVTEIIEKNR